MTESEKWGLPGLMAQLHNNTFFQGQELTALDIDMEKCVQFYCLGSNRELISSQPRTSSSDV